jgi:regulator of sigma E protease
MDFLINLFAFVLVLGVLIFVHELGHFAVAKWVGMKVDEFAIGFPPRLWKKRKGETIYSVNAIPFGGFVRIHGESGHDEEPHPDDPRSFDAKPVWARIAVVIAGVVMNILFAFVVLTIAFSVGFVSLGQDLQSIPGANVKSTDIVVADVMPDSGAAKAGLQAGDVITTITNPDTQQEKAIRAVNDLIATSKSAQELGTSELVISFTRSGDEMEVRAPISADGAPLGVYIQPLNIVQVPVWQAPVVAAKEIGVIVQITWEALGAFWAKLFTQAELDPNVSGPVGIYQATGSAAQAGVVPLVFLTVALSVNLALLNIMPIPALDGGKLVFLIIEGIARRRIVARRLEAALSFAGFVLLIGLILVLSVRDVTRMF